ncbi:MAG: TerC family protein [Chloroflexota bacterium]
MLSPIEWPIWLGVAGFVLVLLLLDLFVFHREAHAVSVREALGWSVGWAALGLAFSGVIWLLYERHGVGLGADAVGQYLAGYLIELALSVDNIFVFAVVFAYFAVPARYQHRVLFWGVVGAIVFRVIFILAGAALLKNFHWIIYGFGALLVFTGIKMALGKAEHTHPERNPVLRLIRRFVPLLNEYRGQAFFVREAGRLAATPLFAVLLVVETTDVLFAVDSIPAIFSVTADPFIVFSSNAFAILGLRSLYFVLADMMGRFVYLKFGLGAVLVFAGAKMLLSETPYKVDTWLSLEIIAGILVASIVVSLLATRGLPATRVFTDA